MDDLYKTLTEAQDEIGEGSFVAENGSVLHANEACARISGYSVEELLALPSLYDLVVPEQREVLLERLRQRRTGQQVTDHYESAIIHKSGRRVDLEVSVKLLSRDGAQLVIIIRDVTERNRAEKELRRQNEYLSALHETSLALMNRLELSELLEAIVARTGALVDTPHRYVYLLEPGALELEMRVGEGVFEDYTGYRMKPGECVPGQVWQTGQPMVVDDYSNWEGNLPQFSRDIRAVVGMPLKYGSEVVGVIGLAYLEEGWTFGSGEVEMLSGFAGLASVALDNARLYARAQQELVEHGRTEEALRESEKKYRTLVEAVQESIGFVDAEERITYCNGAYAAIFDLTPRELIGRSLLEFLDEQEQRTLLL